MNEVADKEEKVFYRYLRSEINGKRLKRKSEVMKFQLKIYLMKNMY